MSAITNENMTMEGIETTTTSDCAEAESTARGIFTRQTGQALIAIGVLFKNIPPFNETIDKSTGDTLITIGRKLKGK
ncbi:MAG: hypothetical protein KPEEDBHJ_02960 [Anaerolineales bacterium]|nr:hypothetical protein [Anaerolineales bacterium]